MRPMTQGFVAAALCVVSILSLQPAHAQNQSTSPTISDQKLDATASAMEQLSGLRKSYEEKLANTAPADQDGVIDEANKALEKAVTEQGLSLEEYSAIIETAQQDPSVRERLVQRLHVPAK